MTENYKAETWVAILTDGNMACIGQCTSYDDAETRALQQGMDPICLAGQAQARQWQQILNDALPKEVT